MGGKAMTIECRFSNGLDWRGAGTDVLPLPSHDRQPVHLRLDPTKSLPPFALYPPTAPAKPPRRTASSISVAGVKVRLHNLQTTVVTCVSCS